MGKQKKSKTQHLSDAEIWDDSALIRSWDEAVAEYEYYHSIHARGEDVEEVLRRAELEEKIGSKSPANTNGNQVTESAAASMDEEYEDGEIEGEYLEESVAAAVENDVPDHESKDVAAAPSVTNSNTRTNNPKSSASSKGSDQVLENIKMAYWWAGYYSGLYEGQQQATDTTASEEQQQT